MTARSVILTTLLGYHPPELPAGVLIRVGGLFGIAEKAVRVALHRMVADGDVVSDGGRYRLNQRLVERQARQDEAGSPRTRSWRGTWEMAVVTAPPRPLADRVALRKHMDSLRLAPLREGIWMRPANLVRHPSGPAREQCTFFESRLRDQEPEALVRSLWDLDAWASEGRRLRNALRESDGLAEDLLTLTAVMRHLLVDPVLPPELLPAGWPGDDLRTTYREFAEGYLERLRAYAEA
jgi:phenylacetic acid degradation operon negative regulatory protein